MPDTSPSYPEAAPPITSVTSASGGVNLDAGRDVTIGGDVVGRDKITTIGYTVEQVSTLLTQISSTFQPKPFDGRSPYLGLDAFSEDEADRFFGRESLVSELIERIKGSRFVIIAGPSGSGKSSLVRAGLIHTLKQGALPNSDRWLYATVTSGRDPIESLALAMSRLAKSPDAGKYLREHSNVPSTLHEFVESQLSDRKDQRAVIFIDQFEEVFTQVSKEDERLAFLNLLTHSATIEGGRITLLVALRSDFVSNCATYPQLNALLNQQFMQVGAMQPDELVSAIARPALQVGLRIDPDLVAQIVNDMQDEPGALPLMQFALKDLFDAEQAKGGVVALTLNDYLARGSLRKALERHADAAFARLSEDEQHLARTIFSGLIEIGRGMQDTRRTATFDELVPVNVNASQVKVVVHKLADARLITTDEQNLKETVSIAHEALIEAWPWLRKLVGENREAIALQNQIVEDAQEWEDNAQDESYLYTGARLATAREKANEIGLGEKARTFVEASIQAEEETRRRRDRTRRQLTMGFAVGFVVMLIIAIFASVQWQEAERQRRVASARQLVAQGQLEYEERPLLGLRLALEAWRVVPSDDLNTRNYIIDSIRELAVGKEMSPGGRLTRLGDDVEQIYPNPAGLVFVLDRTSATGELRRAMDGKIIDVLSGSVSRVSFSPDPDATYFMVEYDDAPAELRRTSDGKIISNNGAFAFVSYSPDPAATYFVLAYKDAPGELYHTADSMPVTSLSGVVKSVNFNQGKITSYCVVGYENFPGELYRTSDGALIASLEDDLRFVTFSQDNRASYFVVTHENDAAELRRSVDGKIIKAFDFGVVGADDVVHFSSDPGVTYVAVDSYRTDLREVFRTVDGKRLAKFSKFDHFHYGPDQASSYVVATYGDFGQPGPPHSELRRITGEMISMLNGEVANVFFSSDPAAAYFVIDYWSGPDELRRATDGAVIATLIDNVHGVHFSLNPTSTYVVIDYSKEPTELRRTADGTLIAKLDRIRGVNFSPDAEATYFRVDDPGKLAVYRSADGMLLARINYDTLVGFELDPAWNYLEVQYRRSRRLYHEVIIINGKSTPKGEIRGFRVSPNLGATYLVLSIRDGDSELRRTSDHALISTLSNRASFVTFSPDSAATYFVLDYTNEPDVLLRSFDGVPIAKLGEGDITSVTFSPDKVQTYLIVDYADAPSELRKTIDGKLIARLPGDADIVTFSPDDQSAYFVRYYGDGRSELWNGLGGPGPLAELGSGLIIPAGDTLVKGYFFDKESHRFVTRYADGRAYLLNLDWLKAMGGSTTVLSVEELIQEACDGPLATESFDAISVTKFQEYLAGNEPQACR